MSNVSMELMKELAELCHTVETMQLGSTLPYFTSNAESNEEAELEFQMHKAMAKRLLFSKLQAIVKTVYEESALELEEHTNKLHIPVTVMPGSKAIIWQDRFFSYEKRVNKASEKLDSKELCIQLARLGVEQSLIDKAKELATKKSTPATFREITVLE